MGGRIQIVVPGVLNAVLHEWREPEGQWWRSEGCMASDAAQWLVAALRRGPQPRGTSTRWWRAEPGDRLEAAAGAAPRSVAEARIDDGPIVPYLDADSELPMSWQVRALADAWASARLREKLEPQ